MAQFLCPSCGSTYFLSSKTGPKNVFRVVDERSVECVQLESESFTDTDIDKDNIYCGGCSWHGSLGELVESHRD